MAIFFQFAQPWWLLAGVIFLVICLSVRSFWYQPTMYVYPLLHVIVQRGLQASSLCTKFFFWIRLISLALMVFLLGKPQYVDSTSQVTVEGIDIVLALDMSGSMCLMDDLSDTRSRLQVAKQEALNFVDQRKNDAIGLVLFGRYALARCPVTLDKSIIKEMIHNLEIGQPSKDMEQATMLSQGLITAVRRLQSSKSKSKVIVLLTDGAPSPGDIDPEDAIQVAKELGIKVYTIGIGGEQGGYIHDVVLGMQQTTTPLNKTLLAKIAQETGGQFFEAKKPKDLKQICQIIDTLEKQSYQTSVYQKFHDYFIPIVWLIMALILTELLMATWVWFIV